MFNGKVEASTISTGLSTTDDFLDRVHTGDSTGSRQRDEPTLGPHAFFFSF
jgi:hypothetical protein